MIKGQLFSGHLFSAVLARVVVTKVNIFTRKPQAGIPPWCHVMSEANDAWKTEAIRSASHLSLVSFKDFDLSLKPEDQRFLPADHRDGLVACVQNKCTGMMRDFVN